MADQLDALSEALEGSGDDLNTILAVLVEDLTAAIASFAGLVITVTIAGEPVTVTAMNSHTASSSMLLPLTTPPASATGAHLVLYAENPGAFVDLAADARATWDGGGSVVLDQHLPPPTAIEAQQGVDELADRSTVDQAIGFLIGQGHPPAQARTELSRRADAAGVSIAAIAYSVLEVDHQPDPFDENKRAS
ncbi:hypothetical protein ABIB25_005450 [Nakamurella sp. UYEF19]|uniref:ANTAR domain-containing protein n=1 Tax=Nakamurella sp. UYEF19 TaxID=1756392 RepID=UPI003399612D